MALERWIAAQLRRPSGLGGRAIGHVLNRVNRSVNQSAINRLGLAADESVLEVGCGCGGALGPILRRTQGFVAGVELSDVMVAETRRRFRGALRRGRLELKQGEAAAIPYGDDRFDCAVATQTIYFWPDPAAGLREIQRVLKPGGRVVLAVEAREEIERRAYPGHGLRLFDGPELERLLADAGLADAASERDGRYVYAAASKPSPRETVVDLVPFILVEDVERSIAFYEALGFRVIKRYEPHGRLEFAGLEATPWAKLMLARVDVVPETGPDAASPGFLYLYTPDLDAFRQRLVYAGLEPDEIEDGPGPGPNRQLCVRDPDGHGDMVTELFEGSVGRDPAA